MLALGLILPLGVLLGINKSCRKLALLVFVLSIVCVLPSCGGSLAGTAAGGAGGAQSYSIVVQVSSGTNVTKLAGTITLNVN